MAADKKRTRDSEPNARIFISYSRKDMPFVDRLEAALKARGFEPLIDRTEIYAFEDWWKRVETLVSGADTIVFVLSPDAVASEVALKEVAHATSLNKRFAPIVCRRVEDGAVPELLRRLNFIFFDDPDHFEASADKLAEALHTDIGWIRKHTEFGETARRWAESDRQGGLLLRPPVLEEAEYWITYRPHGAPPPTAETEAFVAESRKAETAFRRRMRFVRTAIYALMLGIIAGLVAWINQDYIKAEWRWYTNIHPFMVAQFRPNVLTATQEKALKPKDTFKECAAAQGTDYCPQMTVVPAGSFVMGAPPAEKGSDDSERPQHQVTIVQPFAVAEYELTFDEWDSCVAHGDCADGVSDAGWGRGRQPVINVSLADAQSYVAWLAQMTGKPYRLLSEAEYEYATRAGTQTGYPWGNTISKNNANWGGVGGKTAPVGSYPANKFGLYDMVGNVFTWLQDCWHPNYTGAPADGSVWPGGDCTRRSVHAGSWEVPAQNARSAFRDGYSVDFRKLDVGFRVGRTLLAP